MGFAGKRQRSVYTSHFAYGFAATKVALQDARLASVKRLMSKKLLAMTSAALLISVPALLLLPPHEIGRRANFAEK